MMRFQRDIADDDFSALMASVPRLRQPAMTRAAHGVDYHERMPSRRDQAGILMRKDASPHGHTESFHRNIYARDRRISLPITATCRQYRCPRGLVEYARQYRRENYASRPRRFL